MLLAPTGRRGGGRSLRRTCLRMLQHGVDDMRMHFQHEVTEDRVVNLPLAVESSKDRTWAAKINQPVRALALAIDRIREAAFFPQAADENLALTFLDHLFDFRRKPGALAREPVRIEDDHRFVNVCSFFQVTTPLLSY